jgi:hypothetical protein
MTNIKRLGLVALLPLSVFALPQRNQETLPVCGSQEKVAEGGHINVRVSGVYSSGLEMGVLEDTACPDRSIWVELALSSDRNKKKLKNLMDGPGKAYVVFEGELWPSSAGPQIAGGNPKRISSRLGPHGSIQDKTCCPRNPGSLSCSGSKIVAYNS